MRIQRRDCNYAYFSAVRVQHTTVSTYYCTMCHYSQSQCHNPSFISTGFKITLSIESIHDLALSLHDPDSNEIKKRPGDYEMQQDITGLPITSSNVTVVLPVCHEKILAFDWIVNRLMVKANSHQKWPNRRMFSNKVDFLKFEAEALG